MEMMKIHELKEFAENHGFNTGRFLAITKKGTFEFQWLDACYGFILVLQPKQEGFIGIRTLIDVFGEDQEYLPTIGYNE